MSTRVQIRNAIRVLIDQTTVAGSKFTEPELNTIINTAQGFVAASVGQPRDTISIVTQQSVGAYPLPSDNLFIKLAQFGDPAKTGDVKKMKIVSELAMTNIYPNWTETSTTSDGRPNRMMFLDKKTVFIFPRPNATEAGKRLILTYAYLPADIANDTDSPDLPTPFHHLIEHYSTHLCYLGKLANPEMARELLSEYQVKLKLIEDPVLEEYEESRTFEYIEIPDVI